MTSSITASSLDSCTDDAASLWPSFPLTSLFFSEILRDRSDKNLELVSDFASVPKPIPAFIFVSSTMSRKKGGRKAGLGNYGRDETKFLLDTLEGILPIGPDEWQEATDIHSAAYPGRDVESIRRKFATLHRKKSS